MVPVMEAVMALPSWLQPVYAKAVVLDSQKCPYVFGGGHNPQYAPSIGLTRGPVKGYDCSAIVDAALHAGKLIDFPAGTHELERWGDPGRGAWLTVWTLNGRVPAGGGHTVLVEHCVLEFERGVPPQHRFLMGHHTGGDPCGFASFFDTTFYHSRRRAG